MNTRGDSGGEGKYRKHLPDGVRNRVAGHVKTGGKLLFF